MSTKTGRVSGDAHKIMVILPHPDPGYVNGDVLKEWGRANQLELDRKIAFEVVFGPHMDVLGLKTAV